jgi:predicted amidophosphoribosyltransferase
VVFAVAVHVGGLRHAIVRYKYGGEQWWAAVFAGLLAGHLHRHATWFEEFDLLCVTPGYVGPGARRRWDPVGRIAEELAPRVTPLWELLPDAVVKVAETPAMSGRSRPDRLRIAAGPLRRALFVPDPTVVAGARVLVIDDVLTEGSTLREVARVLRRAGAVEVAGLVIARPPWGEAR